MTITEAVRSYDDVRTYLILTILLLVILAAVLILGPAALTVLAERCPTRRD